MKLTVSNPTIPEEESQLVKMNTSVLVISAVFIAMVISFITVLGVMHIVRKKHSQEIELCDQPYPTPACDQPNPLSNGCVVEPHSTEIRLARSYQDQAYQI